VDRAADLNLSVALDIVWNHASAQSLLVNYDTPAAGARCTAAGCGSYFYAGAAGATRWGPRPNFADAQIQQWIVGQVEMLIDHFHIAAFRWDSTSCIRKAGQAPGDKTCDTDNAAGWKLMQSANLMSHSPQRRGTLAIAEDTWGEPLPAVTSAVDNHSVVGVPAGASGGAGFDASWGYTFYSQAVPEITKGTNSQINMSRVSRSCTCIGSPCLRNCVHGASIGDAGVPRIPRRCRPFQAGDFL
jgi:hypothetical protein